MATYYVDFNNNTEKTWTMCVYMEIPNSVGLDSVAWKQTTVPTGGSSGVDWEVTYNALIASYKQSVGIGVYKSSQTLPTDLGTSWKIVYKDNVQQLEQGADASLVPPDTIAITNESGYLANPGIGMSGTGSVFQSNVENGAGAQFKVTPTYYVGLFRHLVLGEVINSNVIAGPLELQYTAGKNVAILTASTVGDTVTLDLSYQQRTLVSNNRLEHLLAMQSEHPQLAAVSGQQL